MNISYLTMPASKGDGTNRLHWLLSLTEGLRYSDKSDDLLWVKRDRSQDWVTYTLRSARTKITAQLQGQGNKISIVIYKQEDVDPTKIFMPSGVVKGSCTFEISSGGLRAAVDYLRGELTADTIYSRATNHRIRIALEPKLDQAPPIFFGGLIKGVELDNESRVDENGGSIHNAILLVEGKRKAASIRVGSLAMATHPRQYKPHSRALASMYAGEFHERVYTFSRDSLAAYYSLQ